MYKILTVHDKIRVAPIKFRFPLQEAVKSSLQDRWEGVIDKRLGVLLRIMDVAEVGEGKILAGDGAVHYPVTFAVLVYQPELHELVKGFVIDVTEFGVFVRIGPLDGMVHVSQIMDDFVSFDGKNQVFAGRDSKRILKNDDAVRARIISISLGREYKIGITTRQPGLGALSWIDAAREKRDRPAGPPAPAKKSKKKERG